MWICVSLSIHVHMYTGKSICLCMYMYKCMGLQIHAVSISHGGTSPTLMNTNDKGHVPFLHTHHICALQDAHTQTHKTMRLGGNCYLTSETCEDDSEYLSGERLHSDSVLSLSPATGTTPRFIGDLAVCPEECLCLTMATSSVSIVSASVCRSPSTPLLLPVDLVFSGRLFVFLCEAFWSGLASGLLNLWRGWLHVPGLLVSVPKSPTKSASSNSGSVSSAIRQKHHWQMERQTRLLIYSHSHMDILRLTFTYWHTLIFRAQHVLLSRHPLSNSYYY